MGNRRHRRARQQGSIPKPTTAGGLEETISEGEGGWGSRVLAGLGFIALIFAGGFIVYEVVPWLAGGIRSIPIIGNLIVLIGRVLSGALILALAAGLGAVSWFSGRALWRITVGDPEGGPWAVPMLVFGMGFWVVPFGVAAVATVLMLVEMQTGIAVMPDWMRPFLDIVFDSG